MHACVRVHVCVVSSSRLCFRMCGSGAGRQAGQPLSKANVSGAVLRDENTILEVLDLPQEDGSMGQFFLANTFLAQVQ